MSSVLVTEISKECVSVKYLTHVQFVQPSGSLKMVHTYMRFLATGRVPYSVLLYQSDSSWGYNLPVAWPADVPTAANFCASLVPS